MWKSAFSTKTSKLATQILSTESILRQEIRTTYILKRKFPTPLSKKGFTPKKLRSRHYVYELVDNKEQDVQSTIDVILTTYVEGLGNIGETVSVKRSFAYNNLLLTGQAVYASPDNLEKYQNRVKTVDDIQYSSPNALLTVNSLSRVCLSVVMNRENSWTIQPWHIKVSFRKSGYVVPEDAISMPPELITGPNMDNEGKEFYVTVTLNNSEKVNVKCRLHHWSTDVTHRIPYVKYFWKQPVEPIFPQHSTILKEIAEKNEIVMNKII